MPILLSVEWQKTQHVLQKKMKTESKMEKSDNLKTIIAKNIVLLRTGERLTQAELAERLNYSDKAVSKWERGESLPDIAVI